MTVLARATATHSSVKIAALLTRCSCLSLSMKTSSLRKHLSPLQISRKNGTSLSRRSASIRNLSKFLCLHRFSLLLQFPSLQPSLLRSRLLHQRRSLLSSLRNLLQSLRPSLKLPSHRLCLILTRSHQVEAASALHLARHSLAAARAQALHREWPTVATASMAATSRDSLCSLLTCGAHLSIPSAHC